MRIAWFTPLDIRSAIGRFSVLVAEELAKKVEIDLWGPVAETMQETSLPMHPLRSDARFPTEAIAGYDVAVYNMGNSLYHRQIFEVSRRAPGIVILHDAILHHFFMAYYLHALGDPAGYIHLMEKWHGAGGRLVAERSLRGSDPVWSSAEVVGFPLVDEALEGAIGGVGHSYAQERQALALGSAPALRWDLAFEAARLNRKVSVRTPQRRKLVLVNGHVNPNRHPLTLLRAIAESPRLRGEAFCVFAGPIEEQYRAGLMRDARTLGVDDIVRFDGFVSEDLMASYLHEAFVCVNIRFPATEGGSASLAQQLLHGKAVIVANTGFASEVSDAAVWKVDAPVTPEDLRRALEKLFEDSTALDRLRHGAIEESARFTPRAYAEGFLPFVERTLAGKPLMDLADRTIVSLRALGLKGDDAATETILRNAEELFLPPTASSLTPTEPKP